MTTAKTQRQQEIWKSPPSLNMWWVEVSNLGRVRTLPHKSKFVLKGRVVEREMPGKLRKLSKDTRGRSMLAMIELGHYRGLLVHRLVAECFVSNPNPRSYNYVFFKNGNISDCRAENLQWGDISDKGWLMQGKRTKHLVQIYDNGEFVGEYFGIGEAAKALGCTKQAVDFAIKRGHLCKGFVVNYKERGNKVPPSKNIEEGRDRRSIEFEFVKMPESIFLEQDIDIRPKAVF